MSNTNGHFVQGIDDNITCTEHWLANEGALFSPDSWKMCSGIPGSGLMVGWSWSSWVVSAGWVCCLSMVVMTMMVVMMVMVMIVVMVIESWPRVGLVILCGITWWPAWPGSPLLKANKDKQQKQTNTEKYRQNVGGPGHPGWPLLTSWVWCVSAIVCQGNTLENCHLCQLEEGERWLMWWFSFPWIFDDRPIMDFYMRDKWQDNKRYHIPCQSPNCHALILSLTLPLPTWSVVPLCPEHHHLRSAT